MCKQISSGSSKNMLHKNYSFKSHDICTNRISHYITYRACGKTASLKHILTGCEYALRSYTWRHNEVLEIFSEASKTCCETANKDLNIINNRAIQSVKEGNISKIARENMRKPSLLEGSTVWHVAADLKHNFIFPTEIALTTKRPDIVIWSVKVYEENFDWAHQRKLEKYENNVSEMAG